MRGISWLTQGGYAGDFTLGTFTWGVRSNLLCVLASLPLSLLLATGAQAAVTPSFSSVFGDAVTGDNQFNIDSNNVGWFVNTGADNYGQDFYERPVIQQFRNLTIGSSVGGAEGSDSELNANIGSNVFGVTGSNPTYFEYLDIVRGRFGFDSQFMYFRIELFGEDKVGGDKGRTSDFGESSVYRIRIGENIPNSSNPNNAGGVVLSGEAASDYQQSEFQGAPTDMFTTSQLQKAFVYEDSDGDVGGPGGVATPDEGTISGYENKTVSDGKIGGENVLYTRKVTGQPWVEFAFDYAEYNDQRGTNLNPADGLPYLVFEANRGTKGQSVYLWNDENNLDEAGSPYVDIGGAQGSDPFVTHPDCSSTDSDIPCNILGNVYELDTLTAGLVVSLPEPATLLIFGVGLAGLATGLRRKAA